VNDFRKRISARLTEVKSLGVNLARVDFEGEGIGANVSPGQFVMVEAPGRHDCVLLRPFSYFLAQSANHIALLVRAVGKGTQSLLQSKPGTPVVLLGPLGNAFPRVKGHCWLVAGGVGAAPFGHLANSANTRVLFGVRTSADLGFGNALRELGGDVAVATDDGSAGFRGTVADLLRRELEKSKPAAIFTCGPTPMMAAVAKVARKSDVDCWVSLEERMGCGFGVCRGCAHKDATGNWRCVCEGGPVYLASEIFGE